MTDEQSRTLDLPLSFLEPGRRYEAQIYRDGAGADWLTNPYDLVIERKVVTSEDRFKVKLARSGGVAVRFRALK